MDFSATFVLPADVVLTPVGDLTAEMRRQFSSAEGDFALTRPGLRTQSKIVTGEVAALLREFAEPRTIADAVIGYSRSTGSDPEETLDQAFGFLVRMIEAHFLVSPGTEQALAITASLSPGDVVGGQRLRHTVQVLEDVEVYQATRGDRTVALKILRAGGGAGSRRALEREELLLRHLDDTVTPELVECGVHDGRKYLATEWCDGVPATTAAAELRREPSGSRAVLGLCVSIVRAYAHLHAQGVIHADVHPRNVLVDGTGRVRIIDYGLAITSGDVIPGIGDVPRGGVSFYLDPEFAAARLAGLPAPASTQASDQYSIAAMLYFLLTGFHYAEFSAEKQEMRRQIAEDPPRPFAPRADAWPEAEAVLARALSKQPVRRFVSLTEFADRLEAAASPAIANPADSRTGSADAWAEPAQALVDSIVRSLSRDGRLYRDGVPTAPTVSVNYGASGLAYALYRLSCLREDPSLLSLADSWATRALRAMGEPAAFRNEQLDVVPRVVGEIALYHTRSGVHAVRALISHAMGDLTSTTTAVQDYIAAAGKPCTNIDLTLGTASTLVGSSLLLDAVAGMPAFDSGPLADFGGGVLARMWQELDEHAPIGQPGRLPHLGIAHGWAGLLYATLMWCGTTGTALPPGTARRLRELALHAEPKGRGLRWKIRTDPAGRRAPNYTSGWCNGSAGQVFLWTEAARQLGDPEYLHLAERAGWNSWEEQHVMDSLCCGLAGVAYGLLCLYRETGNRSWLLKAQETARRALEESALSQFPHSLYKGTAGVALLAAELDHPHTAAMPMFEREYRVR